MKDRRRSISGLQSRSDAGFRTTPLIRAAWRSLGRQLDDRRGRFPYLIDPAVLYGDCQMDLAMTALFGGFTERFYRAYEEASGEALNRDIWPLYQLFYVYMHLNSFGESYLAHTERIVKQYIG
ncbi:fructosamine kinase family protein [Bacillus sonorensis]|nr:fructosamine kinase family protein [Bacillus sonorensis]